MLPIELMCSLKHDQTNEDQLSFSFEGIIFDLDNTLVSSSLNFKDIKQAICCPDDQDILAFVEELPVDLGNKAMETIIRFEIDDALNSYKLAGTSSILALIKRLNIPCAIVTRNSKVAADIKVSHNHLNVGLVISREQFKAKPAPDALLHIAQLWNIPTSRLLYVGDYLYDIQAAINADMHSCLLTFGHDISYQSLATLVVHDLAQLTEMIEESLTEVPALQ